MTSRGWGVVRKPSGSHLQNIYLPACLSAAHENFHGFRIFTMQAGPACLPIRLSARPSQPANPSPAGRPKVLVRLCSRPGGFWARTCLDVHAGMRGWMRACSGPAAGAVAWAITIGTVC